MSGALLSSILEYSTTRSTRVSSQCLQQTSHYPRLARFIVHTVPEKNVQREERKQRAEACEGWCGAQRHGGGGLLPVELCMHPMTDPGKDQRDRRDQPNDHDTRPTPPTHSRTMDASTDRRPPPPPPQPPKPRPIDASADRRPPPPPPPPPPPTSNARFIKSSTALHRRDEAPRPKSPSPRRTQPSPAPLRTPRLYFQPQKLRQTADHLAANTTASGVHHHPTR